MIDSGVVLCHFFVVTCCWLMMTVSNALRGIFLLKKVEYGAHMHNLGMTHF